MKMQYDVGPAINPQCASAHVSPWLAEGRWLNGMVMAYRNGQLAAAKPTPSDGRAVLYGLVDGIALFDVTGALMKGQSKYGGTSTLLLRRAVRDAARNNEVLGGMLMVDSPGGTVAGTDELAADLRSFAKVKPLHAHAEGMVASAAYWVSIQATRITATRMTDVGSIGVVLVLYDTSGKYAAEGIKVHTIASGALKGAFVDGAKVTPAAIEYAQGMVSETFRVFSSEVRTQRKMLPSQFAEVSDGRVWRAERAMQLGLIDGVESLDDAMDNLRREVRDLERARESSAQQRRRMRTELGAM